MSNSNTKRDGAGYSSHGCMASLVKWKTVFGPCAGLPHTRIPLLLGTMSVSFFALAQAFLLR
jgi:hypothetical protein